MWNKETKYQKKKVIMQNDDNWHDRSATEMKGG